MKYKNHNQKIWSQLSEDYIEYFHTHSFTMKKFLIILKKKLGSAQDLLILQNNAK